MRQIAAPRTAPGLACIGVLTLTYFLFASSGRDVRDTTMDGSYVGCVLYGDGYHDDTYALVAWANNAVVHSPNGELIDKGELRGGTYVITYSIIVDQPLGFYGCTFIKVKPTYTTWDGLDDLCLQFQRDGASSIVVGCTFTTEVLQDSKQPDPAATVIAVDPPDDAQPPRFIPRSESAGLLIIE
jgi:hypothetical protein